MADSSTSPVPAVYACHSSSPHNRVPSVPSPCTICPASHACDDSAKSLPEYVGSVAHCQTPPTRARNWPSAHGSPSLAAVTDWSESFDAVTQPGQSRSFDTAATSAVAVELARNAYGTVRNCCRGSSGDPSIESPRNTCGCASNRPAGSSFDAPTWIEKRPL